MLLYLAQIRKPMAFDINNNEGKYVEINGIIKSQRNTGEFSLFRIGNVTVLSEFKANISSKNVTFIGRIHEDIVIADEVRVNGE